MSAVVAGGGLARAAAAAAEDSSALDANNNGAALLPDAKNPDYVYCNDFDAWPDFDAPGWKGEVFAGHGFAGTPVMVRNFDSLSNIAWSRHDSDDAVDTTTNMCVRYSKKQHFPAGTVTFLAGAQDEIAVTVDGVTKVDNRRKSDFRRYDFAMPLTEGEHEVVVEHAIWRDPKDNGQGSRLLCFKTAPEDKTPPKLVAHAIYDSRFSKTHQPRYIGRWSEAVKATLEFGETAAYGQSVKIKGSASHVLLHQLGRAPTRNDVPITIDTWEKAARMANPPTPKEAAPGIDEEIVIDGLPAGKKCYFAAKAIDRAGNQSLLSNVAINEPGPEEQIMDLDGDGTASAVRWGTTRTITTRPFPGGNGRGSPSAWQQGRIASS